MKLLNKLPAYTLSIIVFLLINYLTLVPHPLPDNDMMWFPGADKVVHAIMFGALAGALYTDINRRKGGYAQGVRVAIICAVVSSLVGGEIEFIQQSMNAGRSGEWLDFVADIVGAFAGSFAAIPVYRWLEKC